MRVKTPTIRREVRIPTNGIQLEGYLVLPETTEGVVIFAHGAGSSRFSPRNVYMSQFLQKHNFGTLLFDLLTEAEDLIYQNRFDIPLITERLVMATKWLDEQPEVNYLNFGYFGSSTGAAAALRAAVDLDQRVAAVVSRGGRPDLAVDVINKVKSPTLLIVGSLDEYVLNLNEYAFRELDTQKQLSVVPKATHLFEEPGAIEMVASLTLGWFDKYLKNN